MDKINKVLSGKGKEIFSIFFKDWYSLKEASKIYNSNLPNESRNQSTTAYYFYKFKKLGWLDEENKIRYFSRKTAKGKESTYPNKCPRFRANYNFFFDGVTSTELKDFLLFFLNQNTTKYYLIDNFNKDVPAGVEEVIKQLFLISIALKKQGFDKKSLNPSKILNLTLKNYDKKLQEIHTKYYEERLLSKKKGKAYVKLLGETYPEKAFWYFLNLFALSMIKLFFKKNFTTEVVKTSPKLYFWVNKLYGDFSFVY